MNFELGKEYIVKVTEKGIIPIEEFLRERYIDIDHDDLGFLTDEEKVVVVNEVLDSIRAEIEEYKSRQLTVAIGVDDLKNGKEIAIEYILYIIDNYRGEQCHP